MMEETTYDVNCDPIGELDLTTPSYEEYGVKDCGDVCFSKKTTEPMSKLWASFCRANDFPEFYLRTVAKTALCMDPITQHYEVHDAIDIECANVNDLEEGEVITINNTRFSKETSFVKWDDRVFHKFRMRSGIYLLLCQDVIDEMNDADRRYLCIGR